MKLPRRGFLHLAAGAAALPLAPRVARGLAYPTKPVRIIFGLAPGSAGDVVTRLIAQWLSERLGQQFVVENRVGAGGILAAEAVVRAAPDGYTLLVCGSPEIINATLNDKLNYVFLRDIAPVAGIARGPHVLVVHPSFPAQTLPEFVAYAKANPGKIAFGTAGIGTMAHMAPELFKVMAGVDLVHVPYRGLAPAVTDLLGGQLQTIFATTPTVIGHIRSGKLRALAVTSSQPFEALPELPTVGDTIPGYEAYFVVGLGAPRSTPADIVGQLNKEINTGLADPGLKTRLAEFGAFPFLGSAAEFGKFLADETEKWSKVIRTANIKPP